MAGQICFRCFQLKGDFEVCPYCGYVEGEELSEPYQLKPGTVLQNRYIVGVVLGTGGFGITYKAYDKNMGTVVAIKEFYPEGLVNRSPSSCKVGIFQGEQEKEFYKQKEKFILEAKNMARFSNEEDIVNVMDFFQANHSVYVVMEYIKGRLLKDVLRTELLDKEQSNGYMLAILKAVKKIHDAGILHRDISPDNIFLTGKDSVKIFDFGTAKFPDEPEDLQEIPVVKSGYTPPEQYASTREQGPFTDVYSVGAVFYEMLAGEKPMEAPDRKISDKLKEPSYYNPQAEERLDNVILKAMALNPKLRFQTIDAFMDAIVNKKRYDRPQVEMRKRRRHKNLAIASAVVIPVILVGALAVFQYLLSSNRGLNLSKIKEDTVTVWLIEKEYDEDITTLLKNNMEKECNNITLDIEEIPFNEYEEKIKEAVENDSLPDVFCTDFMSKEELEGHCMSMDKLYYSLSAEEYLFLDTMENKLEIPTGWQIGVYYQNSGKASGNEMAFADQPTSFTDFGDLESEVGTVAGDLSYMDDVREVTIEKMPPVDFAVSPYEKDDRIQGCFTSCYGVNADASDNVQEAGMAVISMMLNNSLQSAMYMGAETDLPINKNIYHEYRDYKMGTYLSFLKDYDTEDIEINDTQDMCSLMKKEVKSDD